jgi:hypothetical protein
MPTFDLAAGLRMVGTRMFVEDAFGDEVTLEAGATVACPGVVDGAVEFLRNVKSK